MTDGISHLAERSDRCLRPFIEAATCSERDDALEAVLADIQPVVRRVIARRRNAVSLLGAGAEDDMASTVVLRLLRRLNAMLVFAEDAITHLDDYVATLTYNTIYDFLRRRFPQRTRLRNRLRYVLQEDPRFSIETVDGVVTCGLRSWGTLTSAGSATTLENLSFPGGAFDQSRPGDSLETILISLGAPVAFEALQRTVADLWNVTDGESPDALPFLSDPRRSQYDALESRDRLAAVWQELVNLPQSQRTAILLNLRDPDGLNAAAQFILLGIASFDELAHGMGLTPERLEMLWNDLPLSDLAIAGMLDLSRQQVINLRQTGRRRLGRRLREQPKGAGGQKGRK